MSKKRNHGTGSLYERGHSWVFEYKRKKKSVKKSECKTKTEANKKLAEFIKEIDEGNYLEPSKITLSSFVNTDWLDIYAKNNLNPSTLATYQFQLKNHILPVFGKNKLQDINKSAINRFLNDLSNKSLKPASIDYIRRVFMNVMKAALDSGYIKINPVKGTIKPKITKKKLEVYTPDEIQIIFNHLDEEPKHWQYFIKLALATGMRKGELLALQWKDIDFKENTIHIQYSLQNTKEHGYKIKEPKTESSKRIIKVDPYILKEIKNQLESNRFKSWTNEGETYNLVFNIDGKPLYPSSPRKWWDRFLKRISMRSLTIHDLRHTHATFLIENGVHPKVIADRLGHASITTTMNLYGHQIQKADEEAANLFGKIFSASHQKKA